MLAVTLNAKIYTTGSSTSLSCSLLSCTRYTVDLIFESSDGIRNCYHFSESRVALLQVAANFVSLLDVPVVNGT